MIDTQVIDTNVILRYLLADHPEHFSRAAEFMAEVTAGRQRAYVPESVLTECVFVVDLNKRAQSH